MKIPESEKNKGKEIAVFGGGCFWCIEAVFKMLKGINAVLPGYAGGTTENPTYEEVSSGHTGHAEVIYIEYDPSEMRYEDLLTVFFASHDPSTLNRQGNDVGTQYRSIIFYTTDDQKKQAEDFIKKIDASSKEGEPAVTEVRPFAKFYPAEDYHENYFARHKNDLYCQIVINPKVEKVQKDFSELLKSNTAMPENEKEWREKLTPEQYEVLRGKKTEMPFSGKLLHENKDGVYLCSACGNPLFSSDAKFESGTGWPSFDQALLGAVKYEKDKSLGAERTEVLCARCGSHLGHVFDDGPTKTGKRYCLNSVCLDLEEKAQ